MDRGILTALLKDADDHIAARRQQIERLKIEIGGLEVDGSDYRGMREVVQRIEAALALYVEHRDEIARELAANRGPHARKFVEPDDIDTP